MTDPTPNATTPMMKSARPASDGMGGRLTEDDASGGNDEERETNRAQAQEHPCEHQTPAPGIPSRCSTSVDKVYFSGFPDRVAADAAMLVRQ